MKYDVVQTDKASDQLYDIINYIASNSSVDIAMSYLDILEKAIANLSEFPKLGVVPRYSILKKQGYRVLIVERHLVFYKLNDSKKQVVIYAIFDSKQEYKNLI